MGEFVEFAAVGVGQVFINPDQVVAVEPSPTPDHTLVRMVGDKVFTVVTDDGYRVAIRLERGE